MMKPLVGHVLYVKGLLFISTTIAEKLKNLFDMVLFQSEWHIGEDG